MKLTVWHSYKPKNEGVMMRKYLIPIVLLLGGFLVSVNHADIYVNGGNTGGSTGGTTIDGKPSGTSVAQYYTTDVAVATSSNVTFSQTAMPGNVYDIINGKFYVPTTNGLAGGLFSQTATLTVWRKPNGRAGDELYQAPMSLVVNPLASIAPVGTNILHLASGTGFASNNLVYVMGTTPEWSRVSYVSGNDLYLQQTLQYSHAAASGVSLAREFSQDCYDVTGSNTLWGTVSFTSSQTVSLRLNLVISR